MEGYIYLLKSTNTNKLYLGSTINPQRRIREHNNKEVKATKNETPWRCLLVINTGKPNDARKIEYYIKKQKEKLTIKNIIKILNKYFDNLER